MIYRFQKPVEVRSGEKLEIDTDNGRVVEVRGPDGKPVPLVSHDSPHDKVG